MSPHQSQAVSLGGNEVAKYMTGGLDEGMKQPQSLSYSFSLLLAVSFSKIRERVSDSERVSERQ